MAAPSVPAALLLVAVLLSAGWAGPAAAQEDPDGTAMQRLWYRSRDIGQAQHNLTATPPNGSAPIEQPAGLQRYDIGRLWGYQTAVPAPWTLQDGQAVRTEFVFEHLDGLVPLADLRSPQDPDPGGADPSELRIYLELRDPEDRLLAEGHTAVPLPAVSGQARHTVTIDADVTTTMAFDPAKPGARILGITVGVLGRYPDMVQPDDAQPVLLLEGREAASWIDLPGFPVAAFRAWEDAEALDAACQVYDLSGAPCPLREASAPADEGEGTAEAAATTWLPTVAVLFALLAALVAARWRRA